jgi:hypothetical protein
VSDKTEAWAWTRIQELEQLVQRLQVQLNTQRHRAELWKHRCLRNTGLRK